MYFLGIDLGTSSVKVSVLDANTKVLVARAQFPETEAEIISLQKGWAEQDPEIWWNYIKSAILKANASRLYNPKEIKAIGIAYQMHGLVIVNKAKASLRNSIIWCDSRATSFGEKACNFLGQDFCLETLLNSPGNFTAAKLAWVKANEPSIYEQIYQVLLPGDFIAMKFTGETTTTSSALSEGIFWDFKQHEISKPLLQYFDFDEQLFPKIHPVFSSHGSILTTVAAELGLSNIVEVTYKAGDQPNNALSLNVTKPGEVAVTAGTSGVIYAVSDKYTYDLKSRVNSFAHVNHEINNIRTGILLCINGAGSLTSWAKKMLNKQFSYSEMNQQAANSPIGSKDLYVLPFGNGAERMLQHKDVGAHIHGLNFNYHQRSDLLRAMQEGIAFAFRYGLDILIENEVNPNLMKAGNANLFLSDVFCEAFAGSTKTPISIYDNDASLGAAIGAGMGLGVYQSPEDAFIQSKPLKKIEPQFTEIYEQKYQEWKLILMHQLSNY